MSKKNKENNEQANVQIEDNNNNNQKNNAPKGGGDSYFPGNEKVTKLAWTEARCLKHAKRYDSLTEWKKGHQSSYKAAESHGWINSCSSHMSDTSQPLTKKQRKIKDAS